VTGIVRGGGAGERGRMCMGSRKTREGKRVSQCSGKWENWGTLCNIEYGNWEVGNGRFGTLRSPPLPPPPTTVKVNTKFCLWKWPSWFEK